tara:strand:- start:253 stop:435 length:183 start_codon:yes stop_codon:yes gene_type:complete
LEPGEKLPLSGQSASQKQANLLSVVAQKTQKKGSFPIFTQFRAHPKDAGFPEKFQWITVE